MTVCAPIKSFGVMLSPSPLHPSIFELCLAHWLMAVPAVWRFVLWKGACDPGCDWNTDILTDSKNAEQNNEGVHVLFHSSRYVGLVVFRVCEMHAGKEQTVGMEVWEKGWFGLLKPRLVVLLGISGVGRFGKGGFFGLVLSRHSSFAPRTIELPTALEGRSDNLRSEWLVAL